MENKTNENKVEKIVLAAGCFWGVQDILDKTKGVKKTLVGYIGGDASTANYKQICTGETGHAEAVYVEFHTHELSLNQLLGVFWRLHNPTTLNRQGPDVGSQYRSEIFYYLDTQKEIAELSKCELEASEVYSIPVVTKVTAVSEFFEAEEYHQKYFEKNPGTGCHYLRPE